MPDIDALFNVYKPSGPTSHDVVARLRRASGVKRVGHAGTLDPLAEGVLLVAAGQATRAIEYLAILDKAYEAQVTFGVQTRTDDAEGAVVAARPTDHLDRAIVERALDAFRGRIEQRPPAYSAISVGGRRLYDLARRGEAVEAPVRPVEITRLDLLAWAPPVATLHVECSKGTYIRSLARDLGASLGCGGHLSRLVRRRVGAFAVEDAIPLSTLEDALRAGEWQRYAIPAGAALAHLPALRLDEAAAAHLAHGRSVAAGPTAPSGDEVTPRSSSAGDVTTALLVPGVLARAYDPGGRFLAIVRRSADQGQTVWRPEKVFIGPA